MGKKENRVTQKLFRQVFFRHVLILTLCLSLITPAPPAKAESFHAIGVEVVVGIVLISVGAGVGIIYLVTRHPSIKGCIASTPDGLEIAGQGGQPAYRLTGDTASLKPGDLVKIKGRKKTIQGQHTFVVSSFVKDYGSCPAHP